MSVKRFDGTNWVDVSSHKRFDGTNWVDTSSHKRFDGTNWVDVLRNQVSPSDVVTLTYTYTTAYYTYDEYDAKCNKCGKPIFSIVRERETSLIQYKYWDSSGAYKGYTGVIHTLWNWLTGGCSAHVYGSTIKAHISKEQFKTSFNGGTAQYDLFKNMRWHEDGSTRDLFTSTGYLICPFCE